MRSPGNMKIMSYIYIIRHYDGCLLTILIIEHESWLLSLLKYSSIKKVNDKIINKYG